MKRTLFHLLFSLVLVGCTGVAAAYPMPATGTPVTLPIPTSTPVRSSPDPFPVETPGLFVPATPEIVPTAAWTPTPTATVPVYAYGPAGFPPQINPLTGLPAADPALLERRPMVIKVTNFPRSVRPQWGLSQADHVIEYDIGDSMTRFIGVFYGRDALQVGPVRSARLFDEQVLRMYDAIFVFGWADDPILERLTQPDIRNQLVVERSAGNCPPLCRLDSGLGYNNLFTNTSLLSQYVSERGTYNGRTRLDGLRFELAVPKSGHPAEMVFIRYSSVSYHYWQYDPLTHRYLRFQETEDDHGQTKTYAPLTDSLNGEQLDAANLVVLLTRHDTFYESNSTSIYDMPFQGKGSGYGLRDGQIYPLTWSRPVSDTLPVLTLPNGLPYPLKPGNVWFEILGESSTLEPQADNGYSFRFSIP